MKTNTIIGWTVFAIALVTYIISLEPTVSYWDCGEFITSAYKLQIGHAPGAPFFLLLAKLFSLFAGGNSVNVAYYINMFSAVCSAFTILFLYHSFVLIAQNSFNSKANSKNVIIITGGIMASLTLTFTDSFWFSAVEGEVYALSSLFTAITFWAVLKWNNEENTTGAFKWIILIFYLLGLSVGIHLLNLLAIPAIALVYYFKNYKSSKKGIINCLLFSFSLLGAIVFVVIPGISVGASYTDLFFVNVFKLPFNTGVLFFVLFLFGAIVFFIKKAIDRKRLITQLILVSSLVFILGYSSYTLIFIRSIANPPVDLGNVENIFNLTNYLNREQYGKRSLVKGPLYNGKVIKTEERYTYLPMDGKYEKDKLNPRQLYRTEDYMLFPRMWSTEPDHIEAYKNWGSIKGKKPTFANNIRYFIRYQVGHMYMRYFMWNFSGRQNDIQGFGGVMKGNWITGINFLDKVRLGDQQKLPSDLKSNPGRNSYFMLPFIVGILGMFFQYKKDAKNFLVLITLFILTGLAIVVYLNEIPITPRERDYVYVGSFYVFAMWIGFGFMALYQFLERKTVQKLALIISGFIVFSVSPFRLFQQNLDDHNRTNRYVARDMAYNYLNSCEKNAILFTAADNDTYPLWYLQDVEGIRQDIHLVLEPFLYSSWYIQQNKQAKYNSSPINISYPKKAFIDGKRSYLPVVEKTSAKIDYKKLARFIEDDTNRTKVMVSNHDQLDYIPGRNIRFKINKENALNSKTIHKTDIGKIPEYFNIFLKDNYLFRSELIILDIIANNNWERPIYFSNPLIAKRLGLTEYLQKEGLAYKLKPIKQQNNALTNFDTDNQYRLLMKDFKYGNMENPDVYLDWTTRRNISIHRYRDMFTALANQLKNLGDAEKAEKVMNRCLELFPKEQFAYDYFSLPMLDTLQRMHHQQSDAVFLAHKNQLEERLKYYVSLHKSNMTIDQQEIQLALYGYRKLMEMTKDTKTKEKMRRDFGYYVEVLG